MFLGRIGMLPPIIQHLFQIERATARTLRTMEAVDPKRGHGMTRNSMRKREIVRLQPEKTAMHVVVGGDAVGFYEFLRFLCENPTDPGGPIP